VPSWRSLVAGLCLLAAAGGLYATARGTSMFAVRDLRIRGAPPALAQRIEHELAPVVGTSLVGLDGAEVLARVEAIPAVRSASYDRAFPHTLVVRVVQERAAAIVRRGAEAWLVSSRGRVLARTRRGAYGFLPRIWVPKTVEVALGAIVRDADVRRAAALVPFAREGLPIRVRNARSSEGELALKLADGLELRLGESRDLPLKLAAARKILPLLASPAGGGPTYLDVSVPERPVAGTTLKSKVQG
jgi:cell division protein FtsQ